MMPTQMIIIVVFSGFTGWLISWFTLRLLFPQVFGKTRFAINVAEIFQQEFESSKIIDEKITDSSLFEKLKPEIEKHVDFFLNEKLATVFPLLYKFMGEKTLLQFKDAFMIEIDLLFPVIIKKYISSLKQELRLDRIISERINAIPVERMRHIFFKSAGKEVFYFKCICTFAGLLTGLVTVLVIQFIWF